MRIEFMIPGEPKGKGRPRFARMGRFVKTYSPEDTVNFESWVKLCFIQAAAKQGWEIIGAGVPIKMKIECHFSYPKSMSAKKRSQNMYVTKKPDWDNIGKAICDTLNGVAYHDDSQVVSAEVLKLFTDGQPQIIVTLYSIGET